ncbi:acyl-CoA thioesterase [Microbotryomycetes sp. JL221]|nr:acyl-CoA thioesterase [Microbotryomycetes sp. JL221]
MSSPEEIGDLTSLIEDTILLDELDTDLYRSRRLWKPSGGRGVFGGNVIAQSAWAATLSVRAAEPGTQKGLHSLHSYFLNFGDVNVPIIYHVTRLRTGRSYSTLTVVAKQRGSAIFTVTASFTLPEPGQPIKEAPMPAWPLKMGSLGTIKDVPLPDDLPPTEDRLFALSEAKDWPPKVKEYMVRMAEERRQSSIEIRDCDISEMSALISARRNPEQKPQQMHWLRTRAPVRKDAAFQKCVLAYASDLQFIGTAARSAGLGARTDPPLGMIASLDHSMWFYDNDLDVSNWLLFYMESQLVRSGRGLVHGRLYKPDGTLAVLCTQEGVIRARI